MKMITMPFILQDLTGFKNLSGLKLKVCLAVLALALFYNVAQAESEFKQILPEQTISQVQADTLYGDLGLVTKTEGGSVLSNVDMILTSVNVPLNNPYLEYHFVSNANGFIETSLPTYIDTLTATQELELKKPRIFPTIGSELNAIFTEEVSGNISISTIFGQQVLSKDFSGNKTYLSFERLSIGPYVYRIQTSDHSFCSGLIIKQNLPVNGPANQPPEIVQNELFKNTTFQDYATYQVKYEKEGWLTDSTNIDVYTGENGSFFFYLEEPPPLPATHDIAGIVKDGNANFAAIPNATIVIEHLNTGEFYMTQTGADGSFFIEDLPVQMGTLGEPQRYLFHVGGSTEKYAFANTTYKAPIYNDNFTPSDTINDNFNVVLMDKDLLTSAQHIKDQNKYGWLTDTTKFYIGNSFETPEKKERIRKFVSDYNDLEPGSYTFVEVYSEVTYGGFNIEEGTHNTNPNDWPVITPIGDTLTPTQFANVTMNVGDSISAYHEFKQALGYRQVYWTNGESVLESPSEVYSLEDNVIANISNPYWKYVYQDSATWIRLTNIVEDIDDIIEQAEGQIK